MRRVVILKTTPSSSSVFDHIFKFDFPGEDTPPAIIAIVHFDYLVVCRQLKLFAMHPSNSNCVLLSVVMVNRHLRVQRELLVRCVEVLDRALQISSLSIHRYRYCHRFVWVRM